jgi:hypothetical protein
VWTVIGPIGSDTQQRCPGRELGGLRRGILHYELSRRGHSSHRATLRSTSPHRTTRGCMWRHALRSPDVDSARQRLAARFARMQSTRAGRITGAGWAPGGFSTDSC